MIYSLLRFCVLNNLFLLVEGPVVDCKTQKQYPGKWKQKRKNYFYIRIERKPKKRTNRVKYSPLDYVIVVAPLS